MVSVIIPAYRVTEFIGAAIDSALGQKFADFEVIVVNDCCPDTPALERVLERYQSRIVYVKHERNLGLAASRNSGIRASRGEFLAFLDGDDIWEPYYLEVQMGMLRDHPKADAVYGNARIFGDSPLAEKLTQDLSPSRGPVTVRSLFAEEVIPAASSLVKREIILRVGSFDPELRSCEDFDLWVRMAHAGGVIMYHSKVILQYRRRDGSLSSSAARMYEYRIRVAEKTESQMTLSPDERDAVQEAKRRWTAEYKLESARKFFVEGDSRKAAEWLGEANAYYKRPKLALLRAAMTFTPGVLRLLPGYR
jgi:glycosyltransferase involved in cell wall biosynthesis